jgi:hypothetical protein
MTPPKINLAGVIRTRQLRRTPSPDADSIISVYAIISVFMKIALYLPVSASTDFVRISEMEKNYGYYN